MMKHHEQSEHSRENFRCSCGKAFACSEDLRRHSRSTSHAIHIKFHLVEADPPGLAATSDADLDDWEIVVQ